MLTCPHSSCDHAELPTVGQMAAHLVERHLLGASKALIEASALKADLTEVPPMTASPAPAIPRCGYCKRPKDQPHTVNCPKDGPHDDGIVTRKAKPKRAPVTRSPKKKPAAPSAGAYCTRHAASLRAPATSGNGFAGALAALRAERDELAAAIAALERLEARR